jgi:hypothetical protein
MSRRRCFPLIVSVLCFSFSIIQIDRLFGEELTPKDLIAKHLRSIGKPEDIAKIKSRGVSGKVAVEFVQGAKGLLNDGQFLFVSEGRNMGMKMVFKDINYPGDYFAYNGKETSVGYISPGQRSPIADFIFRFNGFVKEGLLGGILSTSWPLLKPMEELPEMHCRQELVAGVNYPVLEYGTNKQLGDVKVKLFFDPKTFQHVKSEFLVRHKNDMSALPGISDSRQQAVNQNPSGRPNDRQSAGTIMQAQADSIYVLTEKFGNFGNVNGIILPQDYFIDYSVEGQSAFIARWAILLEHWMHNAPKIDQGFFVAQK